VFKTAFEIDQRWLIEHAGDRTPYVCQAQSLNVFLPANVQKSDLHRIHWEAWQKGVKSLYYCRSKSIQRAESNASWKRAQADDAKATADAAHAQGTLSEQPAKYDECLACQ
jgi:ribonucleoside-diphosphate reductase alpha chain